MPRTGGGSSGGSGGRSGGSSSGGGRSSSSSSSGSSSRSSSSSSSGSSSRSSPSSSSSSSAKPAVFYRADGQVDGRCSAVRSGAIILTSSGAVDGRSAAVRSQEVLLTNDGNVDRRSSLARSPAPESSPSRVITNVDGTIDARCEAVRNGDIILRADGKIDARSAAVRSGQVRLTADGNPALNSAADIHVPQGEHYIGYTAEHRQLYNDLKKENPGASEEKLKQYCEYKLLGEVKTGLLRLPHQQQKYRKGSSSEYKDSKDAAHKLSLEVIASIMESKRGPRFSFETVQQIARAANGQECFRMVTQRTNRSDHRLLDAAILAKSQSGEKLTKAESDRAKVAFGALQSISDQLPEGLQSSTETFFHSLNLDSEGSSVSGSVVFSQIVGGASDPAPAPVSPSLSSLATGMSSLSVSSAPEVISHSSFFGDEDFVVPPEFKEQEEMLYDLVNGHSSSSSSSF